MIKKHKLERFWKGSQYYWLIEWTEKLPKREYKIFLILGALFLISFIYLAFISYFASTIKIPTTGGTYTEGLVGSPHFINPILAPANEVDRYLSKLIYPSLLEYNILGEATPYLAKDYKVDNQGKEYTFFLDEKAVWDDGSKVTAKDVVFTIKSIKDPVISSPLFRIWDGVKVEAIDDKTVRFSLESPYAFFLQNTALGIMPSHIWGNIAPESFALSEYNLKPVGAGPYRFKSLKQDENNNIINISLEANANFFKKIPFIEKISFKFYKSQKEAINALKNKDINGLDSFPPSEINSIKLSKYNIYNFNLPRYFALFINSNKNTDLKNKSARQALAQSINKKELIKEVLNDQAEKVESPISKSLIKYYVSDITKYDYDIDNAKKILSNNGFNEENPLKIVLTTINDPLLNQISEKIKYFSEKAAIKTEVKSIELSRLREDIIRDRDYEIFLFGQALQLEADPFSLWHSSQRNYPGLNLTDYANKEIDNILTKLRETFDVVEQKELFKKFQQIISKDIPAIFLFSPYNTFIIDNKIKNIQTGTISLPEDRLNQITSWYINTERKTKN